MKKIFFILTLFFCFFTAFSSNNEIVLNENNQKNESFSKTESNFAFVKSFENAFQITNSDVLLIPFCESDNKSFTNSNLIIINVEDIECYIINSYCNINKDYNNYHSINSKSWIYRKAIIFNLYPKSFELLIHRFLKPEYKRK